MKITISIAVCLLLLLCIVKSQIIIRSSINCFGNSSTVDHILFRQSAGQPSNTSCFTSGMQLRQGFQQPVFSTCQVFTKTNITIELYPNPATTATTLAIHGGPDNLEIHVSTITGKELLKIPSAKDVNILDCSVLPAGIYLVSVVTAREIIASAKLIITKF